VSKSFLRKVDEGRLDERDGLIIDLRGNRGGLIAEAAQIASLWLDDLPVCFLENRHGENEIFSGSAAGVLAGVPTAVLVDADTASAAEIFAAALQDYGYGRLFGDWTFGKGVSMTESSLPSGGRLTIVDNRWYSPLGRSVHGVGLMPDEYTASFVPPSYGDEGYTFLRAVEWLKTQKRC
jgi:carboxyl-terminal processing protease